MNESTNSENNSMESEKPAPVQIDMDEEVKFPPFPEPKNEDFDEDITLEERVFYKAKFKNLSTLAAHKLHCTACDRHLGTSVRNESRMRSHPMLRTLMCDSCHTFYNSGEFEKGDDGSELYCRWCGQGGQVYCCSNCPHVFCAKCIRRNLGNLMIKEIEETDDWKCFKCNPKYLWDLRAVCWAAFRYCDLRNKIIFETQDPKLKEAYQKECEEDRSECCKLKPKRKEKKDEKKPKEPSKPAILKPTSTIQVKKFASINIDDQTIKNDKKTYGKRSISPKNKNIFVKNPITLGPKMLTPVIMPPLPKKLRMVGPSMVNQMRFNNDRKITNSYPRIRPKLPTTPIMYNGLNYNNTPQFNNMLVSDNINLSLDSLTQGLDISSVGDMANVNVPNDVVCTPDFPLEPLCEVVEDNNDDDVQCIGPVVNPKNPPPLISRTVNPMPELGTNNIIQMTENDVTVNSETGGLKFRVDPQTLSSNKMYRLPDGRVFAINANPNMPGGYSATIVAITEDAILKLPSKGATYAAKLCSVGSPTMTPPPLKPCRTPDSRSNKSKRRSTSKSARASKENASRELEGNTSREFDLNAPVEWYRYNLIDAVDALEYSLSRLNKLKQEATTMYLRTRTVSEMRHLNKRLDRLLNTSTCRFNEIRENLNKELKQYVAKKIGGEKNTSDDDDDVEILQDDNDDPIFIDENSVESTAHESQDIDLTILGSSDHNDSSEKSLNKTDGVSILKSLCNDVSKETDNDSENISILPDLPSVTEIVKDKFNVNEKQKDLETIDVDSKPPTQIKKDQAAEDTAEIITVQDGISETKNSNQTKDSCEIITEQNMKRDVNGDKDSTDVEMKNSEDEKFDDTILKDENIDQSLSSDKKEDDQEISEEMIKSLLCDGIEDEVPSEKESVMDVST